LRDQIRDIAEKNGRSMNAEIIARLAESLEIDAVAESPGASMEAMKPLLEAVRDDLAGLYEERFARIEKLMEEVNRQQVVTYNPPRNTKTSEDDQ